MVSDKHTWRRLIQFTCWWELVVRWARPFITLSFDLGDEDTDNCMLFFHQPFLIFVDSWLTNWGSLEMQLKFLLDCLTAWQRVVLCLLMIRRPSWWSKKEPHWYLHESFISDDLGMSSCAHGCSWFHETPSTDHHWLITFCWHEIARHDVGASHCPSSYYQRVNWCL